jgi:hypothetical protein
MLHCATTGPRHCRPCLHCASLPSAELHRQKQGREQKFEVCHSQSSADLLLVDSVNLSIISPMYICIALKLYERAEARCRISMLEADDGASRKRLMYVSAGALSAAPAREQKAKHRWINCCYYTGTQFPLQFLCRF